MTQLIQSAFPIFNDLNGAPLENGYIYIGTAGTNPVNTSNQISVYFDSDLQTPVSQPIRTVNGYPSRSGSPAQLYTTPDYSIVVHNSNGELVYSSLSPLLPINNTDLPWYDALKYGDGSYTDSTISSAISTLGSVNKYVLLLRKGDWVIDASFTIPPNVQLMIENGVDLQIATGVTLTYNGKDPIAPVAQFITLAGTGALLFGGDISKLYPQWWGAIGDATTDCTAAIQAAIDCAKVSKIPVYIQQGVYKLTDTLTLRNTDSVTYGGFIIYGDGYLSCLYQTGSGKNVLTLGRSTGSSGTALEGMTIRDLSIVGTTGTNYGLYLNEIARSHFQNLYICADTADIGIKGCLLTDWEGIKCSYATFNENPISGITIPTNRQYGIYTETGSLNSYTTNAYNGLVVEGHSVGGIYVEGGSTNTYTNLTIEGEGGYGITSSAEWDCFNGVYFEGITGNAMVFQNTQKITVNSCFTNIETITIFNAIVTFMNTRANFYIQSSCQYSTFINCDGSISYDTSTTAGNYFTFIGCTFVDSTHVIQHGYGNSLSGGDLSLYSANPPRPLKTGLLYTVNPPSSGLYHEGDKVYFSEGNAAGNLGPRTGGYIGAVCINRQDTTLSSSISAGATSLPITSSTDIAVGDRVGVEISSNNYEWSIVTAIGGGPDLTVSPAITSAASSGVRVATHRWSLFGEITGFQVLDLNSSTPTVLGGRNFVTSGAGTITDLDDGWTGQEVRIFSDHAVTITDGTNIFLNGSTNFVMAAGDSLTLVLKTDGNWYEVSRSVN